MGQKKGVPWTSLGFSVIRLSKLVAPKGSARFELKEGKSSGLSSSTHELAIQAW